MTVSDNSAQVDTFSITKIVNKKLKDSIVLTAHLVLKKDGDTSKEILDDCIKNILWEVSDTNIAEVDKSKITSQLDGDFRAATLSIPLKVKKNGTVIIKGKAADYVNAESKVTIFKNTFSGELDGWCVPNANVAFGYPDDSFKADFGNIMSAFNTNLLQGGGLTALFAGTDALFNGKFNQWFGNGGGGYCFGMSMLAAANYNGTVDLKNYFTSGKQGYFSEYGYDTKQGQFYSIANNKDLIAFIERMHYSQISKEVKSCEVFKEDNYSGLISYLKNDNSNPLIVHMVKHAVLIDNSADILEGTDSEGDFVVIKLCDPNTPASGYTLNNAAWYYSSNSVIKLYTSKSFNYKWQYMVDKNGTGNYQVHYTGYNNNPIMNISGVGDIKFYDISQMSASSFEKGKLTLLGDNSVFFDSSNIELYSGSNHLVSYKNGGCEYIADGIEITDIARTDGDGKNIKYLSYDGDITCNSSSGTIIFLDKKILSEYCFYHF